MTDQDSNPLFLGSQIESRRGKRAGFHVNYPLFFGAAGVFTLGVIGALTLMTMQTGVPSLQQARDCLKADDTECAEADYKAYVRKYPSDASATAVLAITLTNDGHHQEALPYYKSALALGVATYDTYANYAISLNITGQVNEAIKMNYAALRVQPNLMDVRTALADQLVRQGRAQEAVTMLDSYDQTLVDEGQSPWFEGKVAQIRADHNLAAPSTPALAAASGPQSQQVPLQGQRGALFVPVVVDDALTLNFVVDSGASDVTIPADVARTLARMGKLSAADVVGQGVFTLANGVREPGELVKIHSMKIGGQEVHDVIASVSNANGQLLLGQSFLRRFKSWSIDNNRRVLVLQG